MIRLLICLLIFGFSFNSFAAPAALQVESSISGYLDNAGKILANGKIEFFTSDAYSTYKPVYSDAAKTTVLAQPISLNSSGIPVNSAGTPVAIFADGVYWMRLKSSAGLVIRSYRSVTYQGAIDYGGLKIDIASSYGRTDTALTNALADYGGSSSHVTFLFNSGEFLNSSARTIPSNIKFELDNGAYITNTGALIAPNNWEFRNNSYLVNNATVQFTNGANMLDTLGSTLQGSGSYLGSFRAPMFATNEVYVPGQYSTLNLAFAAINKSTGVSWNIVVVGSASLTTTASVPVNVRQITFRPEGYLTGTGQLTFTGQYIETAPSNYIFRNGTVTGNITNLEIYPRWFGAIPTDYGMTTIDSTTALQKVVLFCNTNYKSNLVIDGIYSFTDELFNYNYVFRIRMSGLNSVDLNGTYENSPSVLNFITTNNSKYIFNTPLGGRGIKIDNITFKCSTGGGVIKLPTNNGTYRIMFNNINTIGIDRRDSVFNSIYKNSKTQTYPEQILYDFGTVQELYMKDISLNGGFIGFKFHNIDDSHMENIRAKSFITIYRDHKYVGASPEFFNLYINNLEIEGNPWHGILNLWGNTVINGFHYETQVSASENVRNLYTSDSINATTATNNNVIVFSEDMTNILHPDISVIEVTNRNNTNNHQFYLVKSVSGTNVTVYANNGVADTYQSDVYWSSSSNTVVRHHESQFVCLSAKGDIANGFSGLTIRDAWVYIPSNRTMAVSGFISPSTYSISSFTNYRLEVNTKIYDAGIRFLSTRSRANDTQYLSDHLPGVRFENCSQNFIGYASGYANTITDGIDLSLGKENYDLERPMVFSKEQRSINNKWVWSLNDIGYSRSSRTAYRYPIELINGPLRSNQKIWAALGNEFYLYSQKFPSESKRYMLKFTCAKVSTGSEILHLDFEGIGTTYSAVTFNITSTPNTYVIIFDAPTNWTSASRVYTTGTLAKVRTYGGAYVPGNSYYFIGATLEVVESGILSGTGTPENNVYGPIGTIYLNKTGSTGTTMYIKESGSSKVGWVAK